MLFIHFYLFIYISFLIYVYFRSIFIINCSRKPPNPANAKPPLLTIARHCICTDRFRYEQLSRLHELYNGKVGVPKHVPNNYNHSNALSGRAQSASMSDVFKNGTADGPSANHDHSMHPSNDFDNNSIASEPAYLLVSTE